MSTVRLTHHASRLTVYVSLFAVIAILLASASVALAQISANYDLSWHVIAGGGGHMGGPGHTIAGTIGQPLVGPMMTGSGHALCSGFWCGLPAEYRVYLPLVLRNSP
jgi:hypothetical protein